MIRVSGVFVGSGEGQKSRFVVVATEDGTIVRIFFPKEYSLSLPRIGEKVEIEIPNAGMEMKIFARSIRLSGEAGGSDGDLGL